MGRGIRQLEELLEAVAQAVGNACSRDVRLRSLLADLKSSGLELRLVIQPRPARGQSPGFAVELHHPWPRAWSQEDAEVLRALGILLEEHDDTYSPPQSDGRFT